MSAPVIITAPVRRRRGGRRGAGPARIATWPPAGVFWREVRAALPTVAAVAAVMALIAFLAVLHAFLFRVYHNNVWLLPTADNLNSAWCIVVILVFFLVGILCGAEETENGTADFARRLPVSRLRIYLAKTAGGLFAVLLWLVLAAGLVVATLALGPHFLMPGFTVGMGISQTPFSPLAAHNAMLGLGLLFFFCGQAAGAWIGRVILSALAGGVLAIAYVNVLAGLAALIVHDVPKNIFDYPLESTLVGSLLALAAALYRFLTREGR